MEHSSWGVQKVRSFPVVCTYKVAEYSINYCGYMQVHRAFPNQVNNRQHPAADTWPLYAHQHDQTRKAAGTIANRIAHSTQSCQCLSIVLYDEFDLLSGKVRISRQLHLASYLLHTWFASFNSMKHDETTPASEPCASRRNDFKRCNSQRTRLRWGSGRGAMALMFATESTQGVPYIYIYIL